MGDEPGEGETGARRAPTPPPARRRPRLSVVATSRNDDHGGHLTERMQWFVDGLAWNAERTGGLVELVLVEWSPPPGRPGLGEMLRWPGPGHPLAVRILTVPAEVHDRLVGPAGIPMMQMIAKNVGIRRARGELVLATNIDVLLSPELFDLSMKAGPGTVLRADRYDVEFPFPPLHGVGPALEFCARHPVRYARRDGIYYPGRGRALPIYQSVGDLAATLARRAKAYVARSDAAAAPERWSKAIRSSGGSLGRRASLASLARDGLEKARGLHALAVLPKLHTNACGDFTLLAAGDWCTLRAYPEWIVHSWYLDSLFLHQALSAGLAVVEAEPPAVAYHMEHEVGSGWSPEAHARYLGAVSSRGMAYLSAADYRRHQLALARRPPGLAVPTFNHEDWGLAEEAVPETEVSS